MIFRRLLGFLRPYRGQVVASVLLAIVSQICGLTIPDLTGRSINAATDGDRTLLLELAALIVARARSRAGSCSSAGCWPAGCRWPSSTTCETACTRTCSGSRTASSTATRPAS